MLLLVWTTYGALAVVEFKAATPPKLNGHRELAALNWSLVRTFSHFDVWWREFGASISEAGLCAAALLKCGKSKNRIFRVIFRNSDASSAKKRNNILIISSL
jgi:hypothetical protein